MSELPPLPVSKPVRVYAQMIRTACALVAVGLNAVVLTRVFHVI